MTKYLENVISPPNDFNEITKKNLNRGFCGTSQTDDKIERKVLKKSHGNSENQNEKINEELSEIKMLMKPYLKSCVTCTGADKQIEA